MITLTGNALETRSTAEYRAAELLYNDRKECARRSGVPKINHIDEGLLILEELQADLTTMRAWCLHPVMQMDDDLIKAMSPEYFPELWAFDWQAVALAVEYRHCANAYLCRPETDDYDMHDLPNIALHQVHNMLIADKVQNKKDFITYHHGSHDRSDELFDYFNMWLRYLDVTGEYYNKLCNLIDEAYDHDETKYLLSSPANAERLSISIGQLK